MKHINKCNKCGQYTMKEECNCGGNTTPAKPLKYTPGDHLANYRRKAKEDEYFKRGLL